jgi:hypothetical protein
MKRISTLSAIVLCLASSICLGQTMKIKQSVQIQSDCDGKPSKQFPVKIEISSNTACNAFGVVTWEPLGKVLVKMPYDQCGVAKGTTWTVSGEDQGASNDSYILQKMEGRKNSLDVSDVSGRKVIDEMMKCVKNQQMVYINEGALGETKR